MSEIPQLAQLGKLFKSSERTQITEPEEEYVIHCIKHVFDSHFVFQFECRNTLNDSILENVSVHMQCEENTDPEEQELIPKFFIPLEKLVYDEPGSVYAVYERKSYPTAKYQVIMKFNVRDCDPDTEVVDEVSYPDEYQPESIDVFVGDYMIPTYIPQFEQTWQESQNIVTETYQLSELRTVKDTVEMLEKQLGLKNIGDVKEDLKQVNMGGVFLGGLVVLCNVKLAVNPTNGVTLQLNVKSKSLELADRIANSIQ
jgi:coatomer protein complex subunit gamma